jgi:tetratricopeptide (TPR) repeat protein
VSQHARAARAALAAALALAAAGAAQAGGPAVTSTRIEGVANAYLGSEFRETVNSVATSGLKFPQAMAKLQPVLDWCDAKFASTDATYLSVRSDAEAADYRREHPDVAKLVLVDDACPGAYKQAAFVNVDVMDYSTALAFLAKAAAHAPYYAQAHAERGFILNQMHKPAEGAEAYRLALAILDKYPDAPVQGLALRGLAYSLVDLGQLRAARDAYAQSQKFAPDSQVAKDELQYIDGELAKSGGGAGEGSGAGLVPAAKPAEALDEDARKAIAFTRKLEAEPLAELAPAMRSWLLDWEEKSTQVSVLVCDTSGLLDGKKFKYSPELMVQGMFGMAAWQLEHPGAKGDELAVQLAGVRSTLKAYAAILAAQPKQHHERLDALAAMETAGELEKGLASVVAEKCSMKGAVNAAAAR